MHFTPICSHLNSNCWEHVRKYCCFVSVEPTETVSDESLVLPVKLQDRLLADVKLPFVVDKEDILPRLSVEVSDKPEDSSLVQLADWTVSQVDKESETCVLSCSLSVDSDKLYEMKELPVLQVEIKTKDGVHSHKHTVKFEYGMLNSFAEAETLVNCSQTNFVVIMILLLIFFIQFLYY